MKTNIEEKIRFIEQYQKAVNAADGSRFDANANVSNKNVVTLGNEIHKGDNIQINRHLLFEQIRKMYNKELARQYVFDLESHVLYKHDETANPGTPYCVAVTMYPFLVDGLTTLGGPSTKPTDLKSYCGEFVNLVFCISSQFAGAVATPEFLMYMDYFIRRDYGDDYLTKLNKVVDLSVKQRTLEKVIENSFQQVVHSINMPTGARGYQPVFWNISYFDRYYFEGVFGDFRFPDGSAPKWETLDWLQRKFMTWFNEERLRYILTFPVETAALLTDGQDVRDKSWGDWVAKKWSEGASFFVYLSDSPDSLSSCCRLRNSLADMKDVHNHTTHQYSMGTASVATGSKGVMTINLNRVVQQAVRRWYNDMNWTLKSGEALLPKMYEKNRITADKYIVDGVREVVRRVHRYQSAYNEVVKQFLDTKLLNVYQAGYIDMNRQYLTIGVNGLTDSAEFLGIEINDNPLYESFVNTILETINIENKRARTKELIFNTEFVPGENLSVKNRRWDAEDGYFVSARHEMYSSYFFNPEDDEVSIVEKMKLHGKRFVEYLDGGSACHLNISEHLTEEQYRILLGVAVKNGTNYFTFNCRNTVCNDCGYISKDTLKECPHCHSKNLDYLTRIIGYLKRVSSFSAERRREEAMRFYE